MLLHTSEVPMQEVIMNREDQQEHRSRCLMTPPTSIYLKAWTFQFQMGNHNSRWVSCKSKIKQELRANKQNVFQNKLLWLIITIIPKLWQSNSAKATHATEISFPFHSNINATIGSWKNWECNGKRMGELQIVSKIIWNHHYNYVCSSQELTHS